MIPFFRKIRYRLAEDNQFFKYSRYAVGEIVLVVIGILIALQINNWNESKKEKAQINKHLNSLKGCLEEDKAWLENVQNIEIFRFHSMYKLIELAEDSTLSKDFLSERVPYKETWIWNKPLPELPDPEFIYRAFSWSGRHMPMVSNMHCIDEMKNTGMFSKFENDSIKMSISNYYTRLKFHLNSFDQFEFKKEEKWHDSLRKDGVIYIDVSNIDDPLSLIRNNIERKTLLMDLARNANWKASGSKILIDLIDEIIFLINQHLKDQ